MIFPEPYPSKWTNEPLPGEPKMQLMDETQHNKRILKSSLSLKCADNPTPQTSLRDTKLLQNYHFLPNTFLSESNPHKVVNNFNIMLLHFFV